MPSAEELGIRWIHIPIVDLRDEGNAKDVSDLLDEAAAVLADPANQPIFFHCHHGLNRASMAQIAYRTKYCGWTLDQATDEVARTVGPGQGDPRPRLPPHGRLLQRPRAALESATRNPRQAPASERSRPDPAAARHPPPSRRSAEPARRGTTALG